VTVVQRWLYRTRQVAQSLHERRTPVSDEFLAVHLDARGQALFRTMSPRDQAHSMATAQRLLPHAGCDPDLVQAALLHDVGKGPQTLMQRIAFVLLLATRADWLDLLTRNGAGTRGALYRSLHHSDLGAEMAGRIGCSRRVCELIAKHHQPPADDASRALQRADEVA
jgi:putative nucleotidyltransferase with HDIG domain